MKQNKVTDENKDSFINKLGYLKEENLLTLEEFYERELQLTDKYMFCKIFMPEVYNRYAKLDKKQMKDLADKFDIKDGTKYVVDLHNDIPKSQISNSE